MYPRQRSIFNNKKQEPPKPAGERVDATAPDPKDAQASISAAQKNIEKALFTKESLLENARYVRNMKSVIDLTGNEFSTATPGTLKEKVVTFFNSIGNEASSPELGEVALTTSSFRDDKGHGLTFNKVNSFKAIPAALEKGRVIDIYHPQGKPQERITVAAKIKIAGESYFIGVMVLRDKQSQRVYLHDIITEKAPLSFTTEPTANGEGIRDKGNLFITSILQNALLVKEKTKKSLSLSSSQNNTQAEAEAVVFEDSAEQAAAADGEGATTVKDDTDQKNASVPERKTYYGGFTIDEMDRARGLVKNFDLLSRDTKVRALFECVPQSTAKKYGLELHTKQKVAMVKC